MKVVVFDLGGTLMQYVGMPHSWVQFYKQGFDAICGTFGCRVSEVEMERSIQCLTEMKGRAVSGNLGGIKGFEAKSVYDSGTYGFAERISG